MSDSTTRGTAALDRWQSYERQQYEVWADGESLRVGMDSIADAVDYAERLSPEWKVIELVAVTRKVTRVR